MDSPPGKKRRLDHDGSVAGAWSEPLHSHGHQGTLAVAQPETLHDHGMNDNYDVFVCYGMVSSFEVVIRFFNDHGVAHPNASQIPGLPGICTKPPDESGLGLSDFLVVAQSDQEFVAQDYPTVKGKFSTEFIDIIHELRNEPNLRLQFVCHIAQAPQQSTTKRSRYGTMNVPCSLSLILYGPSGLATTVGEFFQEMELYIQDPRGCDWNVRYHNPHRLSSMNPDECVMTFSLHLPTAQIDESIFQKVCSQADVLGIFVAQQRLAEAPQPDPIRTRLQRYDPRSVIDP